MDPTLEWIYASECPEGGLSAWRTEDGTWQKPYPEVTGYAIPTLLRWNAHDLAERCAAWLLKVQNADGSYNGLDGMAHTFDTAAIVEGLRAVGFEPARAVAWLMTQITSEGFLQNSPTFTSPEIYNLRASAILGNVAEADYWAKNDLPKGPIRSHYYAYALEGLLNMGKISVVRPILEMAHLQQPGLFPWYVNANWEADRSLDMDYCATAQMGVLFERVGLPASHYYDVLKSHIDTNGGFPHGMHDHRQIAWGAKYWLDFKAMLYG